MPQKEDEDESEFAQRLRDFGRLCSFTGWPPDTVTELLRDRFIAGLKSTFRKQVK